MKKEDLEKTYEELDMKIEHNNELIEINNERQRIAKSNRIEDKALLTFLGPLFPYMGLMFLLCILGSIGVISLSVLSGTILAEVFPMIIFGGMLGIGTIIRKRIEKKYKLKERLKEFTKATTQSEILEETIKYEIELDKCINRNNSINKAKNLLKANQATLESLSNKYEINEKNTSQTKEEAQEKVNIFSNILQKQYNELDILTTKEVLRKEFYITTKKMESKLVRAVITSSYMTIYYLPSLIITKCLSIFPSNFISYFAPFIAIMGCSIGYAIKREKDDEKVFNNLSKTLGEDTFEKQQDINDKIREISATIIQLQEQKRALEYFSNIDDENEQSLETSITNELTYNGENLSTPINEDISNTTEENEKGPSLVLRKHNYSNPSNNK